ncbi:hypothetical protein CYMTET_24785, partial [Cymbomonas tetramitiformis]
LAAICGESGVELNTAGSGAGRVGRGGGSTEDCPLGGKTGRACVQKGLKLDLVWNISNMQQAWNLQEALASKGRRATGEQAELFRKGNPLTLEMKMSGEEDMWCSTYQNDESTEPLVQLGLVDKNKEFSLMMRALNGEYGGGVLREAEVATRCLAQPREADVATRCLAQLRDAEEAGRGLISLPRTAQEADVATRFPAQLRKLRWRLAALAQLREADVAIRCPATFRVLRWRLAGLGNVWWDAEVADPPPAQPRGRRVATCQPAQLREAEVATCCLAQPREADVATRCLAQLRDADVATRCLAQLREAEVATCCLAQLRDAEVATRCLAQLREAEPREADVATRCLAQPREADVATCCLAQLREAEVAICCLAQLREAELATRCLAQPREAEVVSSAWFIEFRHFPHNMLTPRGTTCSGHVPRHVHTTWHDLLSPGGAQVDREVLSSVRGGHWALLTCDPPGAVTRTAHFHQSAQCTAAGRRAAPGKRGTRGASSEVDPRRLLSLRSDVRLYKVEVQGGPQGGAQVVRLSGAWQGQVGYEKSYEENDHEFSWLKHKCTHMEACALRFLITSISPAMKTYLAPVESAFTDCDTVMVGIHVRLGNPRFAHEALPQMLDWEVDQVSARGVVNDTLNTIKEGWKVNITAANLMFEWAEVVGRKIAAKRGLPKSSVKYFLATDTDEVQEMAHKHFDKQLVTNKGPIEHLGLLSTEAGRKRAAADFWLLTQCDGLVLSRSSHLADKAVLLAMHIPVIMRCKPDSEWTSTSSIPEEGVTVTVPGMSCRYVQMQDPPCERTKEETKIAEGNRKKKKKHLERSVTCKGNMYGPSPQ